MGAAILGAEGRTDRGLGGRIASLVARRRPPGAGLLAMLAAAACVALGAGPIIPSSAAVATGTSLLVLVLAALVDAVEHRLPNVLVACAAVPVVATLLVAGSGELARSSALGAALVAGPLLATHLVTPGGMGFGDVKAGVVLGAAMGLIDVEVAVLTLVLGLGAGAAWGIATKARSIALGPALVAGAVGSRAHRSSRRDRGRRLSGPIRKEPQR